jgi:formate hydrogenlyase transcriptional activator
MEDQLQFEKLLADISARFVNLPTEQIDAEIEDAQRRVCECLGVDQSTLWQWSDETPHYLALTHHYNPPNGPERLERIDGQEAFPWLFQKMLLGKTLAFSTERLPPEAARDKETRRHYGVTSSVVIPLSVGGGPLVGVLAFDTLGEERAWPEPLVKRLHLIAQVFVNALERKRSEKALRESEARLSLAADSAGGGPVGARLQHG